MGRGPELEGIFREHHTFVWRVVRRFGVPDALVDDAVQEVFMVLHRRRGELTIGENPRGLLYGIARKVATRQRERSMREPPRLHAVSTDEESGAGVRGRDPEQLVALEEAAAVVRQALEAMDEGKRMTFLLVDVEGMSVVEVADCLGINLNTCHARVRAARQLVQKAVARHRAREEGDRVRAAR